MLHDLLQGNKSLIWKLWRAVLSYICFYSSGEEQEPQQFKLSEICPCLHSGQPLTKLRTQRLQFSPFSFPSPLSKVTFMKHISPPAPLIADVVRLINSSDNTSKFQSPKLKKKKYSLSCTDTIKIGWDCRCLFLQKVWLCVQLHCSGQLWTHFTNPAEKNHHHLNMVLVFFTIRFPFNFCFAQKCGPLKCYMLH